MDRGTYIDDIRWKSFILNIALSSKIVSGTSCKKIGEVLESLIREVESRRSRAKIQGEEEGEETYASSNPWIASLIPSAPEASAPAGKAFVPFKLLSSETRSDSSLDNVSFCQNTHRWGLPE